jgi:uncharacterized protein YecT (DUF1311 family)
MRLSFASLTVVAAMSGAAATFAQVATPGDDEVERAATPAYGTCLHGAHATIAIEKCDLAERDRQQHRLEAVLAHRLAAARGADKAALKASQDAWTRDAHDKCEPYRLGHGSWSAVRYIACQRFEITRRRLYLERGGV